MPSWPPAPRRGQRTREEPRSPRPEGHRAGGTQNPVWQRRRPPSADPNLPAAPHVWPGRSGRGLAPAPWARPRGSPRAGAPCPGSPRPHRTWPGTGSGDAASHASACPRPGCSVLETAVSRGPLIRAPGPSRVDKHVPVRTGVLLLVCGLRTQEPDVSSLFLTSKTKTPRGEEEPSAHACTHALRVPRLWSAAGSSCQARTPSARPRRLPCRPAGCFQACDALRRRGSWLQQSAVRPRSPAAPRLATKGQRRR